MAPLLIASAFALAPLLPPVPEPAPQSPEEIVEELLSEDDPNRLIERADERLLKKSYGPKMWAWLHVCREQGDDSLERMADAQAAYGKALEFDGDNSAAHSGSGACAIKLGIIRALWTRT